MDWAALFTRLEKFMTAEEFLKHHESTHDIPITLANCRKVSLFDFYLRDFDERKKFINILSKREKFTGTVKDIVSIYTYENGDLISEDAYDRRAEELEQEQLLMACKKCDYFNNEYSLGVCEHPTQLYTGKFGVGKADCFTARFAPITGKPGSPTERCGKDAKFFQLRVPSHESY